VDIASVQAHSLEWHENAGQLSKMTIDESKILPENRVPRVTAATWYDKSVFIVGFDIERFPAIIRKYDSGAVGSFTHVVSLQGRDYSCEFEVYADGYCLKHVLVIYKHFIELMRCTGLSTRTFHLCFIFGSRETTVRRL
jgi:hypothetical protein